MFGEALKLYLKYPAEMEYWAGKDEKEIDEELVSKIADEEGGAFLNALDETYKLANEQFKDSIVDPLQKALNSAAGKEGITLSRPRRKDWIADKAWEWYLRPGNRQGGGFHKSIGFFPTIEKSGDVSVLNAYSWILTRGGQEETRRLAEQLGDGWCVTDNTWYPGTIKCETPISIEPDGKPETVVESITDCLVRHMGLLADAVRQGG